MAGVRDPGSKTKLMRGLTALASGSPNLRRLQLSHGLGTQRDDIHGRLHEPEWAGPGGEDERTLEEKRALVGVWALFMTKRAEVMVSEVVGGHTLQLRVDQHGMIERLGDQDESAEWFAQ